MNMHINLNNPVVISAAITLEDKEKKENLYLNSILKRNLNRIKKEITKGFIYACRDGNIYYA